MNLEHVDRFLSQALQRGGGITVLTGAGISAESGIPTFRGTDGYWTIGSQVYHPQEMATWTMFNRDPDAVWQFYLYRLGVCRAARPNAAHLALVELEKRIGQRFTLITQNVDNLHLLAGQSLQKTFQIHGNLFYARCMDDCQERVVRLPEELGTTIRGAPLSDAVRRLLRCPHCGGRLRPHVLWFDEIYNEHHYRYESTLAVAQKTALLIVVGTSGATNLPNQVVGTVMRCGGAILDINPADNPFGELARKHANGLCLRQSSSKAVPAIVERLAGLG